MKSKLGSVLLSGILWGLSYPNFPDLPVGILAWFALVPILLELKNCFTFKESFQLIFPVFLISSPIGYWWTSYYTWSTFMICFVTQSLSLYIPFISFYFIQKRQGWYRAMITFPFLWTFLDWATHFLPHNLQVHYVAYSQANMPYFIQYADITGMWGICFWVIALNVLITFGINYRSKKYFALSAIWIFMAIAYSVWVMEINPKSVLGISNQKTKVSLIQTNIDSYADDHTYVVSKTLDQVVSLSDSAVKTENPDLLILPEAAFPFSLFKNKNFLDYTRNNILNWNTNIAIGYAEFQDSTKSFKNLALVFTPELAAFWDSLKIKEQDVKVYQKEFGLPFMEFMPYCASCPSVRDRQLIRGNEPYTFKYAGHDGEVHKVALSICWEQTYPGKIASLVNQGADFIALMNNDSWFGKTTGAKFLSSFTKLRAIENRRTIARCSNGGISAFVDPFGRVYGEIPWFTENISSQEVICVNKRSLYTKYPNFFAKGNLVLLIFLIIFFEFRRMNKNTSK
jgi:apolipoprotein N-acyltransferase